MDKTSLNRSEYGKEASVERPTKASRPLTSLASEGDQDWNTTSGSNTFKDHGLFSRPSKAKAADNIKASEGEREWNTKRNEFRAYEKGMRAEKAKQNDTLRYENNYRIHYSSQFHGLCSTKCSSPWRCSYLN